MREWHDRFFAGLYGRVLAGSFDAQANRRQAAGIRKFLRLKRGQTVLDMPCGQGRITLELAKLGLQTVGVDRQAGYIRKAKAEAGKRHIRAVFRVGDMRKSEPGDNYDAVVNWFSSFGYFTESQNRQVLVNFLKALKPGGKVLIDVLNRDWIKDHFVPKADLTVQGVKVSEKRNWMVDRKRIRSTWVFTRGGRRETYRIDMKLFNPPELKAMLRKAGFAGIRLYADLKGKPAGRKQLRLIAVAVKSG